jgi:hypothetical protein
VETQESNDQIKSEIVGSATKRGKFDEKRGNINDFNIENMPVLVAPYKDPKTRVDHISVVGLIMSGATEPRFELNDDGNIAEISYLWPKRMTKISGIFQKLDIPETHPKVCAIQEALEKMQSNIEDIPKMIIKFKLPFKVLTEKSAIKREGVRVGDAKLFIIDLMAPPTVFTAKEDDSLIFFD